MADPDGVFRAKLDLASFGDHRRHILSTLRLAGPVEDIAEAARDEKTPAFIDAETGESITYAEYKSNIALLAAALAWPFAGHAALPPRSVVALNLPNSIHTPVILHAVLLAGHVAALVSPSLTKDEAKFQIEKCGARLVVTDGSLWNVGVAAVNSIDESKRPHMVLLSRPNGVSAAGAIPTLRDLLEYGKSRPPFVFTPLTPETAQTTPAVIPFSSGTSGLPKAVLLSHSNQSASILQISSTMRPALGWTPGNNVRYIVSFQPLAHVYGLNYTLGMAMHLRCTIVIMRSFDLTRYLTLVSRYQPRVLFLVPPVVVRLIGTPKKEFEGHDLRSVRYIFCGAAPMRKETEDSLVSLFPNRVDVKQGCKSFFVPGFY